MKKYILLLVLLSTLTVTSAEKILCFGDSITQGCHVNGRWTLGTSWVSLINKKHESIEFTNAGRSGRKTTDRKELIPYLKDLKNHSQVIFFLGVNDLNTPKVNSPQSCLKNINWMVKQCQKVNRKIKINICSSPGLNISNIKPHFYKMGYNETENKQLDELAKVYKKYCQRHKFRFIDLKGIVSPKNYFDGIHPTINGQQQLADYIWSKMFRKLTKIKVACIGDSITFGYTIKNRTVNAYPTQLQNMLGNKFEVRNFGISSRTLLKKGDRPYWREQVYSNALDWNPDCVIIKLGTNDLKPNNWKLKSEFTGDLIDLATSFMTLPSKPQVFLSYPVPIETARYGIEEKTLQTELLPLITKAAKKLKLPIINFHQAVPAKGEYYTDGIHPNSAGAKLMATEAHKMVTRVLKTKK